MKKFKSEQVYHLKKDVVVDLENLRGEIDWLLNTNVLGFTQIPTNVTLPEFYKVFTHLLWNREHSNWFKKVQK